MNELKFFWFFFFFVFLCSTLLVLLVLACLVADILFYFIFSLIFWSRELYFFLCSSLAFFFCLSLFFRNDILGIYILILRGSHSLDRLSIIIQFIMKLLFIMKGLDEDFLLRIASLTRIYSSQSHTHVQSLFTHVVLYYFKDFFLLLELDISTTSLPLFAMHFLFEMKRNSRKSIMYNNKRMERCLGRRGNLFDVCMCVWVCFTDAVFPSLSLPFSFCLFWHTKSSFFFGREQT